MSNNKREKDRESGTGRPIKAIAPKGGSGQGNWGSDQQQIDRGVAEYESGNPQQSRFRKRGKGNEPANFGDLNPDEKNLPKKSWDEYKKEQGKKKTTAYVDNKDQMKKIKQEHNFRKKYKPNKHEKETDKLFAGDNKKKSKNKKKKKKKVLLQTQVFYSDKNSSSGGRGRGRGGYANSMRGGGYQPRGRGGYRGGGRGYGGGYGGGGYRSGGGFGSRGRGNRSNYYDNNQNYQNQNQYQGGNNNNNNNNQNDNVQQQITAQ